MISEVYYIHLISPVEEQHNSRPFRHLLNVDVVRGLRSTLILLNVDVVRSLRSTFTKCPRVGPTFDVVRGLRPTLNILPNVDGVSGLRPTFAKCRRCSRVCGQRFSLSCCESIFSS